MFGLLVLPLIYFSGGERRTSLCILRRGREEKKKQQKHKQHSKFATGNQFIREGSQPKNREAPNNRAGINCWDSEGAWGDSRDPEFPLLSCFRMRGTAALVWSSCQLLLFKYISACLLLSNTTESQSHAILLPVKTTASCLLWQYLMIYPKFSSVNTQEMFCHTPPSFYCFSRGVFELGGGRAEGSFFGWGWLMCFF